MLNKLKTESATRKGVRSGPRGGSPNNYSDRKKSRKTKESKFPTGWDSECVNRVLNHYEFQPEEEAIREDVSEFYKFRQTVMEVPRDLFSTIRYYT